MYFVYYVLRHLSYKFHLRPHPPPATIQSQLLDEMVLDAGLKRSAGQEITET